MRTSPHQTGGRLTTDEQVSPTTHGSLAAAGCFGTVRTPTVPAASAKSSAALRIIFFNMAKSPLPVDDAVFMRSPT
jgi:hypothetical protein